jgi:hypothetical protein
VALATEVGDLKLLAPVRVAVSQCRGPHPKPAVAFCLDGMTFWRQGGGEANLLRLVVAQVHTEAGGAIQAAFCGDHDDSQRLHYCCPRRWPGATSSRGAFDQADVCYRDFSGAA